MTAWFSKLRVGSCWWWFYLERHRDCNSAMTLRVISSEIRANDSRVDWTTTCSFSYCLHPQINGKAMANDFQKYEKIIGRENIFFTVLYWTLNSNAAKRLPCCSRSRKTSRSLSIAQKPKARDKRLIYLHFTQSKVIAKTQNYYCAKNVWQKKWREEERLRQRKIRKNQYNLYSNWVQLKFNFNKE